MLFPGDLRGNQCCQKLGYEIPFRCSIGFHPLHSYQAIAVYLLMLALPRLRFVALGLLIHMGLDGLECIRLVLR
jgi:hypothetical protein